MSDRIAVVEDGVSEAPRPDRPRSVLIIAGVAFAVGLGLGVLATAPDDNSSPTTTVLDEENPVLAPPEAAGGDGAEAVGISEVVQDFPDALVAISRTSGSTVDYLLWPVAGGLSVRSMTGGGDVVLDATSQFIALSSSLPGDEAGVLSMGRYNSIRPVAPQVTSYVFHDSTNGWLAYTVDDGQSSQVFTVKADFDPRQVVGFEGSGATVIGWGDWGWAVQRSPDEFVLLSPQGEFKDSESGRGLATHPSGWVFALDGVDAKLVSAGGGVHGMGDVGDFGAVQAAVFSPDRSMVALDGERAFGILDLESGETTVLSEFTTDGVAWSSDSRFVITGSGSGAVVYDLETGRVEPILRQHPMLAVGVVPLTSP